MPQRGKELTRMDSCHTGSMHRVAKRVGKTLTPSSAHQSMQRQLVAQQNLHHHLQLAAQWPNEWPQLQQQKESTAPIRGAYPSHSAQQIASEMEKLANAEAELLAAAERWQQKL